MPASRSSLGRRLVARLRGRVDRRRSGRSAAPQLVELYEVAEAWPVVATVFPEPYVFNPTGVDREIMDLDQRWANRSIVLPPISLHDIAGAAIRASGIIQTAGGALLFESVKRPGHLLRSSELRLRPRSIIRRDGVGTTITLADRVPNYFHWLIDMVPRLYALEQRGGPITLVVPRDAPAFVDALVERVVTDAVTIERCPRGIAMAFDSVRLSPFTTVWSHGLLRPEIVTWLRTRLVGSPEVRPPGSGRRIFIQRRGTRARTIENEEEVLRALRPFNLEPVRPELLPLAEQLDLFVHAELIVGPCGAGLTNMIAADRAAVVDINPGGRNGMPFHPSFWSLAHSCGHRYVVVPHAAHLHTPSYVVDAARVRAAVEVALDSSPGRAPAAIV